MTLIGLLLRLAYRLRRHFWLAWPLSRWFGLLLFVGAIWALVRRWPDPWLAAGLGLLWLVYVTALAWAGRRNYVHFRALPADHDLFHDVPSLPPLPKLETVPVRASGWFSVEGEGQYFVDLEADFETSGTREHIVLGRVYASRFLLMGRWPGYELGWWYIFFQPATMQKIELGHLHFGRQPSLALRVTYAPDQEKPLSLFLTCGESAVLRRVWDDLLCDAPAEIAASHEEK